MAASEIAIKAVGRRAHLLTPVVSQHKHLVVPN